MRGIRRFVFFLLAGASSAMAQASSATAADMGDTNRPIFISGLVVMEDGSALPHGVAIKTICDGVDRTVATPRGDGKFDFRWGSHTEAQPDASQGQLDTTSEKFGLAGMSTKNGSSLGGVSGDKIQNCELGVILPGYRSSVINLYNHSSTSNPNVGTIVLHRVAADEGHFTSETAMLAPKDAKKAWDEGLVSMAKNQRAEALASFRKAVKAYPKFADAWLRIGVLELQLKQFEPAKEAFRQAIDLDARLIGPWQEMGYLAAAATDWPETARFLDQAIKLDSSAPPRVWYLDATAHYNLKHYDEAERGIRKAIELDSKKQNPRADFLLGLVLIAKEDYAGGATALRAYMEAAPKAADLEMVRGELTRIQPYIH